jgi:ferredoxin
MFPEEAMKKKDLYEDLIKFYEFMLGRLPNREGFKAAVEEAIAEEDLRVFFLLPFMGQLTMSEFEKKAAKAGITPQELHEAVKKLIPEGLVATYEKDNKQVYERGSILTMTELQMVKMERGGQEDAPIRLESARFLDMMAEGAAGNIPTKTPYYRVLSVQSTLTGHDPTGEVVVNAVVPDPRAILPIDIVSEMIKDEPLIVVGDCYCRKSKQILGKGCEHPLETCFYFRELGELIHNAGRGRVVSYEETLQILKDCEEAGLVHNINNVQGHMHSLCNCCACACGVLKSIQRGNTNAGAPSRFVSSLDEEVCVQCGICAQYCPSGALTFPTDQLQVNFEKCIGCGLCVSHCPEGAFRMLPREKVKKIPETIWNLYGKINREAMVGMVVSKFKRT